MKAFINAGGQISWVRLTNYTEYPVNQLKPTIDPATQDYGPVDPATATFNPATKQVDVSLKVVALEPKKKGKNKANADIAGANNLNQLKQAILDWIANQ